MILVGVMSNGLRADRPCLRVVRSVQRCTCMRKNIQEIKLGRLSDVKVANITEINAISQCDSVNVQTGDFVFKIQKKKSWVFLSIKYASFFKFPSK